MKWICEECYHEMEYSHEDVNRNLVHCPNCGNEYYVDDDDDIIDDDSEDESLDVYEAALIWASHGKDEDYTFGYTDDELEDALKK